MPIPGHVAFPFAMPFGTIRFTISTSIAKPRPTEAPLPERIAMFTQIGRPEESDNGSQIAYDNSYDWCYSVKEFWGIAARHD